jgi:hypothetical protein
MGAPENPTRQFETQAARGRKPPAGRLRRRLCLLKGCARRFRPAHGRQRYCSPQCRQGARAWSGWKARLKYRATAKGKQKRNRRSQRYRKRVQERKLPRKETAAEVARVIPKKFFRWLLRPARLLRMLRAFAAITTATILLAYLPTRDGAGLGTRTGLATAAWRAIPVWWKMAPCAAALKANR